MSSQPIQGFLNNSNKRFIPGTYLKEVFKGLPRRLPVIKSLDRLVGVATLREYLKNRLQCKYLPAPVTSDTLECIAEYIGSFLLEVYLSGGKKLDSSSIDDFLDAILGGFCLTALYSWDLETLKLKDFTSVFQGGYHVYLGRLFDYWPEPINIGFPDTPSKLRVHYNRIWIEGYPRNNSTGEKVDILILKEFPNSSSETSVILGTQVPKGLVEYKNKFFKSPLIPTIPKLSSLKRLFYRSKTPRIQARISNSDFGVPNLLYKDTPEMMSLNQIKQRLKIKGI